MGGGNGDEYGGLGGGGEQGYNPYILNDVIFVSKMLTQFRK